MFGASYYGSLVLAAGLVVTAQTPIPPTGDGNGYACAAYGTGVYGAGQVVTSQTPIPPEPPEGEGNGYGYPWYGAGVYGAGLVITSQTPIPPTPITPDDGGGSGGSDGRKYYRKRLEPKRFSEAGDEEDLELILAVWLNLK